MPVCHHCGHPRHRLDRFCRRCGKELLLLEREILAHPIWFVVILLFIISVVISYFWFDAQRGALAQLGQSTAIQPPQQLTEFPQASEVAEPLQPKQSQSFNSQVQLPEKRRLEDIVLYFLGDPNAPVTVIEFGRYDEKASRNLHEVAFADLYGKYILPGKIRYGFVYLQRIPSIVQHEGPLATTSMPQLEVAGNAAPCAGEQGFFWEMYDALMLIDDEDTRREVIDNPHVLQGNNPIIRGFRDRNVKLYNEEWPWDFVDALNVPTYVNCKRIEQYTDLLEESAQFAEDRGIERGPYFLVNDAALDLLNLAYEPRSAPMSSTQQYSLLKEVIDQELG